ncbi:MAG: lipoprotein insertase outer membrane protein LolB [Gammaproteobacteria bacterium]
MPGRFAAQALLTLALLTLGGCASVPPISAPATLPAAQDAWTLKGRIGVQHGEESVSGQLHWQHRADRDELLMISPLGQGVARIVRDAGGVMLEVPNQPPRHAPDVESLTREMLGYALPVSGLAWWVQARPDPSSPFEVRHDEGGRVAQLRQNGWVIDYLQYTEDARPRRLTVTREGLLIRLVADSWQAE